MQVVRDLISRFLRTIPDTFGGKRLEGNDA